MEKAAALTYGEFSEGFLNAMEVTILGMSRGAFAATLAFVLTITIAVRCAAK